MSRIIEEVAKQVGLGAIVDTLSSWRNLEENYERLKQDLRVLLAMKDDTETVVQRNKQKATTNAYELWRNQVSDIAEKVSNLITKYETERETSSSLHKLSSVLFAREMQKRLVETHQLAEKGRSMNLLVDRPPARVLKILHAPKIMVYQTFQSALKKILHLLRNSTKTKTIGVYGMKGVGKTAIMQNLNNNEEVAKLFDIVIFVRVSADESDYDLQWKIAKRLKVDSEGINDPEDVARRIHEELEDKKYLLILDEVVDYINLNKVGIPENNNGSKVVMTAQHPHACSLNGADTPIKVDLLSRDEAWKMFRDIVGPVIDRPGIPPIARRVCNRCSRHPLLINKIARSFKFKESASSWRAGLDDLEERWPDYENDGVNELYSYLMFCYDQLGDERKKKCFLYTSLYPADSKVYSDYLVECWAAQDFLGDVKDRGKYQSARDRGHAILEHLTNVSLLEKGERMVYVSMNGCMRQLALHISSKNLQYSSYVHISEDCKKLPKSETWQTARWVSMIDSKPQDFPTNPNCSTLLALLMQKNPELTKIPEAFFQNMGSLLLLDFCASGIGQLPSSIARLTCLKGLYLNDCKNLRELPCGIRSLELLQFLDIRGTEVTFTFISSHIGYLANLRCLRIPYIKCSDQSEDQVAHTDPDAISKLHRLEELIIEVVSYQEWCSDADSVIQQVASLENLTSLWCSFPSSNILERFLTMRDVRRFTSFRFFVGCQNSKRPQILEPFEYKISKYLRYGEGEQEKNLAISQVLPLIDAFELINYNRITELLDFDANSLEHIRGFLIERCNEISTLVTGNEKGLRNISILPNLEQLHLVNLLNLKCVFGGCLHHVSFAKLQVLALKNCPSLKSIFSDEVIHNFLELRKLTVEDCSQIEVLIVVPEDIERKRDVLPKLEELVLANLPILELVCTNQILAWSSLEQLKVYGCPGLKSLPFYKDKATNLRYIEGSQEWWDELQATKKEHFQHIFVASGEHFS